MRTVLIINHTYFPTGVAMSSRILNFCRLLRDADYQVHVISAHSEGNFDVGKEYVIEGITYEVISYTSWNPFESFFGLPALLKRVKDYISKSIPDVVFMTSSVNMFRRLTKICKKENIPCFVEQCEWLDISSYKFGKLDIRYLNTEYLRRRGIKNTSGVISISRLLDSYYNKQGVKSIRVPTILDIHNTPSIKRSQLYKPIHILFAGSLGTSKEMMKPIIETLAKSERFRQRIIFDVYGPTKKQIIKNIGGDIQLLSMLGDSIVIHSRVPQGEISRVYSSADFLIFIRPQRRSSDAGFPTKFAESMAVGTPIITNNTGDIGLYLKNTENGFLLKENTTKAVCECFERLLSLTGDQYEKMRNSARETAEKNFDYRNYIEEVSRFFSV